MNQVESILNEAVERIVLSLEPRHWQAFVAKKKIPYPYTLNEKIKIVKEMLLNSADKEGKDVY
jgi:hypothetical protein